MLLSFAAIALVVVAILGRQWYLFPAILIMLPLSLILYGLELVDLKYAVVNLPLWPVRLFTGDEAVRYGRVLLVAGLILSVPCAILAILGGLATFFLSASLAK